MLNTPTNPLTLQYSYVFTKATIFTSGSSQRFRLRAQNGVGLGVYSAETVVVADSEPTFMKPLNPVPLTDISPKSIKLTWPTITLSTHTGRDPANYYELQWFNYESNEWDIITSPTQTPTLQQSFIFTRQTIFPSTSE